MSGLGEWDQTPAGSDTGAAPGVAGKVATALEGLDVASLAGGLVSGTVSAEIHRQIQREVKPIVTEAVKAVLTPERLEALRAAAARAAEAELNPPEPEPTPDDDPDDGPGLYYSSVDEFVREFVCPVFRRGVGEGMRSDHRWSARWWESAEAIIRLEAMWRAWEHLRLDPATGMSVWLRDHADHHLGVLMSPSGPWGRSKDTARADEPLPYEPPPTGLFAEVGTATPPAPPAPRPA